MKIGQPSKFHNVETFDLPLLKVEKVFTDLRLLSDGPTSKVYAAKHAHSDTAIALKCVRKDLTSKYGFFKEVHYNYQLSPHPNVVKSFKDTFATNFYYVFAQELAPEGDLSLFMTQCGIGEAGTKKVAKQITDSLVFMHSKELVHTDVQIENVLAYDKNLNNVKLGDFGNIRRIGALIKKTSPHMPWDPPEICQKIYRESYYAHPCIDSWQLGVLIYMSLTGSYPWIAADPKDMQYKEWVDWIKRKTNKVPQRFKYFTPRLLRLLRRLLQPNLKYRAPVQELYKYQQDSWLEGEANILEIAAEDSISDIYVRSSKPKFEMELKSHLSELLKSYGIPTKIEKYDSVIRICNWVMMC